MLNKSQSPGTVKQHSVSHAYVGSARQAMPSGHQFAIRNSLF